MGQAIMQLMRQKNIQPWYEILKKAKELGNVRVHTCAMTFDLMEMKKEDRNSQYCNLSFQLVSGDFQLV
ncbi:MAG: DsrE/DsrF/DrsH-like family protein [Nitrososphaerota archaeon]